MRDENKIEIYAIDNHKLKEFMHNYLKYYI